MTCPHCGEQNTWDARQCSNCGTSLFPGGQTTLAAPSYSADTLVACHLCGLGNFAYEVQCRNCGTPLRAWHYVPAEELKRYTCWKCGGRYTLINEYPDKGTGCIIMALGILFAPVLIGIFFIFIGARMSNTPKSHWQCRQCGLTLPI
jgi:uncharacterized membrane protein YvbJ